MAQRNKINQALAVQIILSRINSFPLRFLNGFGGRKVKYAASLDGSKDMGLNT